MPQLLDLSPEQDPIGLRRDNYPTGGDQLGALVKFVKALLPHLPVETLAEMPAEVLAEVETIIAAVDDVKTAYPKPEGTEP